MITFVIMFVCVLAGQVIRRYGPLDIKYVRLLNLFIISISLPAVIFVEVPPLLRAQAFPRDLIFAIAMPWFEFAGAAIMILILSHFYKWPRTMIGALILTTGLANTSFVGLPVVKTLFGDPGVSVAILIDQLGTFLILATLGLITASLCAGKTIKASQVIRRVLFFPPFLAFVLATLWGLSSLPVEGPVPEVLRKIGLTLIPLALLSVGWQLDISLAALQKYMGPLGYGLGFKLLLWPAIIFMTFHFLSSPKNLISQVTVIEAAMAPMITGAVVASEFHLEPDLAQLMVGLGIPLSVMTLFFWKIILGVF